MWDHVGVNRTPRTEHTAVLDPDQRQRAIGAVVAAAAGDALGGPYEFLAPIADSDDVEMIGGGVLGWEPGEWTDDTSMSIVVLEAAAAQPGHDLRLSTSQDQIARDWYSWSLGTPDIGSLTSAVMRRAADSAVQSGHYAPRAVDFREATRATHDDLPLTAGNGSLMRVHASVLPYLTTSEDDAVEGIEAICTLTHMDPDVIEACILWGLAIRHAVLTGDLDIRCGLHRLPEDRSGLWLSRIEEAESSPPGAFTRNGWVVGAFQGAWASIVSVMPLPEGRFAQREAMVDALGTAVRIGYDTDTVACITGALLGAALGPKAVPPEWRRALFGWPGYEVSELVALVEQVLTADDETTPAHPTASARRALAPTPGTPTEAPA